MTDTDRDGPPPLDLRVARVVEARDHPDADRLLILEIDLGGEERQIIAGIVNHYELEELGDRRIVVVANLEPALIRGQESQGMLLAAEDDEGNLGLLLAPDAEPGTALRPAGGEEPSGRLDFTQFQEHELRATPEGVTVDGAPLEGARLVMDREVYGRLR